MPRRRYCNEISKYLFMNVKGSMDSVVMACNCFVVVFTLISWCSEPHHLGYCKLLLLRPSML